MKVRSHANARKLQKNSSATQRNAVARNPWCITGLSKRKASSCCAANASCTCDCWSPCPGEAGCCFAIAARDVTKTLPCCRMWRADGAPPDIFHLWKRMPSEALTVSHLNLDSTSPSIFLPHNKNMWFFFLVSLYGELAKFIQTSDFQRVDFWWEYVWKGECGALNFLGQLNTERQYVVQGSTDLVVELD